MEDRACEQPSGHEALAMCSRSSKRRGSARAFRMAERRARVRREDLDAVAKGLSSLVAVILLLQ